jgi:hemerythrin-like domain-containing protein
MPIKRNSNIVALSKDHHFGLLFCWKIVEGIKRNIALERIKAYVAYFWSNLLAAHFKEEEELLFNPIKDPFCDKANEDHQIIKKEIEKIKNNAEMGKHDYLHLAQLINQHIRFEERVLFPNLELLLSELELDEIGLRLAQFHTVFKDDYEDEFWAKT